MSKKIKIAIILVIVAIVIGVLIYANNKKKSEVARLAAATPKPMSLRDKIKAGIVRTDVKMMPKINVSAIAIPFEEQPDTATK